MWVAVVCRTFGAVISEVAKTAVLLGIWKEKLPCVGVC